MTIKKVKSLEDLGQLLSDSSQPPVRAGHDGKGQTVKIALDTKGRKGKTVTVVSGFQHNPATMEEIARVLKQHCGAGGTVKQMTIEIQGDQRLKVREKLLAMNYASV